nr:immunoglobulin heavy chain junction region [Macaca mulatta]MOV86970.1 immunoglobulin heavy chain junction region [Macaca mulatta]MOV87314.1 immunoglobulin heavy chain junction region [Macaca mulatta]MOV87440.1 immunoglobulin heavy chain junction region [Macaca mulatta]MOV88031.1 immunoglobulin heavy chain junction region [Macaca mulatta]
CAREGGGNYYFYHVNPW